MYCIITTSYVKRIYLLISLCKFSTLLDLIANRKYVGTWSGEVYIDHKPRGPLFSRETAYVLQDDVHISTLTVEETLLYAAWTRLEEGTTLETRQERVNQLLEMMGLSHVKNSLIGDANTKGISGGQLKRLSIAVEIVGLPKLIFLDEPTSGLDSSISLEVMSAVKNITKGQRTCMSTIHQPSKDVFALFDKLCLVAGGRMIYYGPTSEVTNFFSSPKLGYKWEGGFKNPAEYAVEISSGQRIPEDDTEPTQVEQIEKLFKQSKYYKAPSLAAQSTETEIIAPGDGRLFATSTFTQLQMMLSRTWISRMRNKPDLIAQFLKNVGVAILFGIVYINAGHVSTPLYQYGILDTKAANINSLMFMCMMFCMAGNVQAVPYLCSSLVLYRRELKANAYGTFSFFAAQIITALPIQMFFHLFFIIILYFMVDFSSNAEHFFYYLFNLYFANIASYASALAVSAAIEVEVLALAAYPAQFLVLTTFTGYAIKLGNIPDYWYWVTYIDYCRWCFTGLMVNQWEAQNTDDSLNDILGDYSMNDFNKGDSFWILLLFVIGFCGFVYYCLLPHTNKLLRVPNAGDVVAVMARQSLAGRTSSVDNRKSNAVGSRLSYAVGARASTAQEFMKATGVMYGTRPSTVTTTLMARGSMAVLKGDRLASNSHVTASRFMKTEEDYSTFDDEAPLEYDPPRDTEAFKLTSGNVEKSVGCKLLFQDVYYSVTSKADGKTQLPLLTGVSGMALPGQMVALMGASGAGKSTLLDVLAQRKNTGIITGNITYNGNEEMTAYGYVMQDNIHIGILTVRETFAFATDLRLPPTTPKQERDDRVKKILDMLDLGHVAESILGTTGIRGISGGQLKRVSIGVELVTLPDLIFLDEPTTGLDSSISLEVMSAVRNLADQNRTVICTIHQPSEDTFALFNQLLLMAAGRIIYFGPTSEMISYFRDSVYRFHYREGDNPADYVVAVAGGFIKSADDKVIKGSELADYYQTTKQAKSVLDFYIKEGRPCKGAPTDRQPPRKVIGTYTTPVSFHLPVMLRRRFLVMYKDPAPVFGPMFRDFMVGFFYGSVFYQLSDGTEDYVNRLSLIFFALLLQMMGQMDNISMMMEDRLMFYRERGAQAYGPAAYWVSLWVPQIPMLFMNTLLFCTSLYPLSGFRTDNSDKFGYFFFILLLTSYAAMLGAFTVCSIAESTQAALSFFPMFLVFNIVYSGYLIVLPDLPAWQGDWLPYACMCRYCYQGLVLNEFQNNERLQYREILIHNLGFGSISINGCIGLLFLMIGIYGSGLLAALTYIDFEQR